MARNRENDYNASRAPGHVDPAEQRAVNDTAVLDAQEDLGFREKPTPEQSATWIASQRAAGVNYSTNDQQERATDHVDAIFTDADSAVQDLTAGQASVTMYLRKRDALTVGFEEAGPPTARGYLTGNDYHTAAPAAQGEAADYQWSSVKDTPEEHHAFMKDLAYFAVTAGDDDPQAAAELAHTAADCAQETQPKQRENMLNHLQQGLRGIIDRRRA